MNIVSEKHCPKCGKWKNREEFTSDKKTHDGLKCWCKSCRKIDSHKNYLKNEDKVKAHSREWHRNNPQKVAAKHMKWVRSHREHMRALDKKWKDTHKDWVSNKNRLWRERNKETIQDNNRKWRTNNPDKKKVLEAKRRTMKAGNGGVITAEEWKALKEKYKYTCLRCRRSEPEIKLTLDHVKPISKGGCNVIENAQPLCFQCNSGKKDREIDYR